MWFDESSKTFNNTSGSRHLPVARLEKRFGDSQVRNFYTKDLTTFSGQFQNVKVDWHVPAVMVRNELSILFVNFKISVRSEKLMHAVSFVAFSRAVVEDNTLTLNMEKNDFWR